MKTPAKNQTISVTQFFFFIVQTQIGVGFISLPFMVHSAGAMSDGWISVLIIGLVVQVLIFIYWHLSTRFEQSFDGILLNVYGKWIGKFLMIGYAFYFLLVCYQILNQYSYIVNIWAFPKTPDGLIIGLLSLAVWYLVIENLRVVARFQALISLFVFYLIILPVPSLGNLDIRYVMPVGSNGFINIIKGMSGGFIAFRGFELIMFLSSYVEGSKKQKLMAATASNITVTFLYTYLTFIVMVFFSPDEIKLVPQPVFYILKAFTFAIVERIDILFLTIWIVLVSGSLASYIYFASTSTASVMNSEQHRKIVPVLLIISASFSLVPENIITMTEINEIINLVALFFILVVPLVTYLLSFVLKRQGKR